MINRTCKKTLLLVIMALFTLQPFMSSASELVPSQSGSEEGGVQETPKAVFTDLGKIPWAENAIEDLVSRGLLKGNREKQYYPDKDMTRGEYVELLINILSLHADFSNNFTDVQKSDEYYSQMGIAKELGIITGESCNRFRPYDPILRQDMMLYSAIALDVAKKLRKAVSVKVLEKYEDRYVTSCYAFNSSAVLVGEGLIVGWKNKLDGHAYASRAAAAVLLDRIVKRN